MEYELDIAERVAALEKDTELIHTDLKDLKKQNKAIYEIATSVKLMAQDISGVKESIGELKSGQDSLETKLDAETERQRNAQDELRRYIEEVDNKGAKSAHQFLKDIGAKAAWVVIGAVVAFFLYQAFPFLKQ